MTTNDSITIIISEDHKMLREKYVEVLEPYGIHTIGQAANGKETLDLLKIHSPDILLLDLNMPIMDGSTTMTSIVKFHPYTKIIILSYHNSDILINDYIARGAKGYLPKDQADVEMLADTIRRVNDGETVVIRSENKEDNLEEILSRRQLEIIPLVCSGMTNKEIAEEIGLTERAIEKQKQKLYTKTSTHNLVSFLSYAIRQGLHFLGKPYKKSAKKLPAKR
jgi:two-component system response regulator DegU